MTAVVDYLRRRRFRWAAYALLGGATIFCMILIRLRFAGQADTYSTYAFLIQNLLLAWIPLVIALLVQGLALPRRLMVIVVPICSVVWLLFFPNAPYLLTDFQHLRLYSDDPKLWFDVIMVIWFVFTGLLLGLASLYVMHRVIRRLFGGIVGWAFVAIAALISGIGIYVGRYLRLCSWEVFLYPAKLGRALVKHRAQIADPFAYIALYAGFVLFIYIVFYAFGRLLREDADTE
jgi:uncharacterized membrane protein